MEQLAIVASDVDGHPQDAPHFRKSAEALNIAWFERLPRQGWLRYLFQLLCKLFPGARLLLPTETIASRDRPAISPDRPVWGVQKCLGILDQFLRPLVPTWLQQAFGYWPLDPLGGNPAPEEVQALLANPSGKTRKRKRDDLPSEKQQGWVETLQSQLLEEDDPEDLTYEPSNSETDSEEYRSQNDTETDLELEEKDGVVMLRESPGQQEASSGGDDEPRELLTHVDEERSRPVQTSEDGSECLDTQTVEGSSRECVTPEEQAEIQDAAALAKSVPGADVTASTDSQEQWVDVSNE